MKSSPTTSISYLFVLFNVSLSVLQTSFDKYRVFSCNVTKPMVKSQVGWPAATGEAGRRERGPEGLPGGGACVPTN